MNNMGELRKQREGRTYTATWNNLSAIFAKDGEPPN